MVRLLGTLLLATVVALCQLPIGNVNPGGGSGSGDVTAVSTIGKGQVVIGSDGAKAVEPSTLDGLPLMTKGVMSAATYANVVSLWASGKCSGALLNTGECNALAFQPSDSDLTALAALSLVRGGIVYGSGAVPAWTMLSPGTAGYLFMMGANEPAWTAVPTWNQNTTGTAAGLTAQYIDWNSSSGGTSIANKPSLTQLHTQNTDTGTTAASFQLASGSSGARLKNNGGTLEARNAADDAYVALYASEFRSTSAGTAGLLGLVQGTACTPGTNEVCIYAPSSVTSYGVVLPGTVGASGVVKVSVASTTATWSFAAIGDADVPNDITVDVATQATSIPAGTGPTTDAAGECALDTTSDQVQCYFAAEKALPTLMVASFTIIAPVATDDFPIMKAPYGMTLVSTNGILLGSTNIVGQLQECDSAGANCADTDSDITFDGGNDADDGSLSNASIDAGDWISWKTTSASGTPTSLTITFTYRVVPD